MRIFEDGYIGWRILRYLNMDTLGGQYYDI